MFTSFVVDGVPDIGLVSDHLHNNQEIRQYRSIRNALRQKVNLWYHVIRFTSGNKFLLDNLNKRQYIFPYELENTNVIQHRVSYCG